MLNIYKTPKKNVHSNCTHIECCHSQNHPRWNPGFNHDLHYSLTVKPFIQSPWWFGASFILFAPPFSPETRQPVARPGDFSGVQPYFHESLEVAKGRFVTPGDISTPCIATKDDDWAGLWWRLLTFLDQNVCWVIYVSIPCWISRVCPSKKRESP